MTRLISHLSQVLFSTGLSARRRSRAISRLGETASHSSAWAVAREHFREALRLNPTRWRIWVQLGHAAKESGDLVEAHQAQHKRSQQCAAADQADHVFAQSSAEQTVDGEADERQKGNEWYQ